MDKKIRKYLSRIGKTGGRKSRRTLSSDTAKEMVKIRDARRAFKEYSTKCFWAFDSKYTINANDLSWVAEQLRKYGDRHAYEIARKLCH